MNRREFLAQHRRRALAGVPSLGAQESAAIRPGQHDLKLGEADRDGVIYIPRGYTPDKAWPLMVMLHGAGNTGRGVAYTFPLADEFGVVVLAPDSRDEATWDVLLTGYGPDVEFIGAALKHTYRLLPHRSQADGARRDTPTAPRIRCRSASAPARRSAMSSPSRPAS